eukprot:8156967-Alexandrium_andersonii.AAC.1
MLLLYYDGNLLSLFTSPGSDMYIAIDATGRRRTRQCVCVPPPRYLGDVVEQPPAVAAPYDQEEMGQVPLLHACDRTKDDGTQ